MAQQQVALQQVRTGKQRDLPDALEKGQIGFSTDVCRLFIGLPSSSEPSSLVAGRTWSNAPNRGKENVEIITEFTPWDIINDLVNKPDSMDLPGEEVSTTDLRSKSRTFLTYVAYDSSDILESGTVQMVVVGDRVLLAQQNNTNQEDGIIFVTFLEPVYDPVSKRMTVSIQNDSIDQFRIEFIISGWDE